MRNIYVTVPREVYEAFPPGEFHEAAGEAIKEYVTSGRRPPAINPRPDIATSVFIDEMTYEAIVRRLHEADTVSAYIVKCLTDYVGVEV